jgi:GxxExxY protein
MQHQDLSKIIIGCAFRVHSAMGYGFLESVYEKCLAIELRNAGLQVRTQYPIQVYYQEHLVGDFVADLFVNDLMIVELKSISILLKIHEVQLVNYLKATGVDVGLLINFGEHRVDVKRKLRVLPDFDEAEVN